MRHARIGVIGMACLAVTACALSANAYDMAPDPLGKLVHAVCSAGRLGVALEDVTHLTSDKLRDIWEGCRQESVKDLSCYPFTLTKDGKTRIIYMPGEAPSDARYEPMTADCKGRVGRWPAWSDAKEDPTETYRMGAFYADNPPGELPKARSQ
jgi:hypothetical protein